MHLYLYTNTQFMFENNRTFKMLEINLIQCYGYHQILLRVVENALRKPKVDRGTCNNVHDIVEKE